MRKRWDLKNELKDKYTALFRFSLIEAIYYNNKSKLYALLWNTSNFKYKNLIFIAIKYRMLK